jgi:short-subunit dehydrogenase
MAERSIRVLDSSLTRRAPRLQENAQLTYLDPVSSTFARSGGILNVASTIAFQPAPYQAVYGASKAFVLSFSQALWGEARAAGVAVTALCPGPTRTGFVEALGADVGHTVIYRRLADPGPVVEAALRALDAGRAVVIPGVRNKVIAASGRFMPREWLTRVSARWLRPVSVASRPPIEVATRS